MGLNDNPSTNSAPDISGMISGLLSNPAAMSMLSSLIGGMKSGAADAPASVAPISPPPPLPPPPAPRQDAVPALASLLGGAKRDDRRSELLCALKPFVSPSRREMIDRLVGIVALIELAAPLLGGEGAKRNTYI